MEQTWARTSKRSLGEREKKTVRLNRTARKGGSTGNRAQRGRSRALPGSCQKVQDVASLQSLPAPFGPPLGCLAFLPKSPVYKLADTGRRLELKQATPSHRSELGKLQSRQAQARASRFVASVLHPGHLGSRRAPRPQHIHAAHPALRWPQDNSSKCHPLFPERVSLSETQPALWGVDAPTPGFVHCPKRRPARPGHWSPTQSWRPPPPPTHTPYGDRSHGPRVWDEPVPSRVSGQSPARPLPSSLLPSPGGSRHSTPSPSSPSQGRWPGGSARPAIPVRLGVKGLSGRSAGEGVEVWVGPCARGRRTP